MSATLLELTDVTSGYAATQVLRGITLGLARGEAVAVLGANGAGKSTLMKTIAGLLPAWGGTIQFAGQDVGALRAEERARLGIALVPEGRGIFGNLSIEENLLIGGTSVARRYSTTEARQRAAVGLDRVYGLFPVLGERRHLRGSSLSGGQQQMLAIGRALMAEPELLVLDEPCLGLAPKVGSEVYEVLRELKARGQSLIIVEESSRRALEFVDRAAVLQLGRKVIEDRADALADDALLLQAYFGEHSNGEDGS